MVQKNTSFSWGGRDIRLNANVTLTVCVWSIFSTGLQNIMQPFLRTPTIHLGRAALVSLVFLLWGFSFRRMFRYWFTVSQILQPQKQRKLHPYNQYLRLWCSCPSCPWSLEYFPIWSGNVYSIIRHNNCRGHHWVRLKGSNGICSPGLSILHFYLLTTIC